MALPRSMGAWEKKWFYVLGLEANLPAFPGEPPLRLNSWESPTDLPDSTWLLLKVTALLKDGGLIGLQITRTGEALPSSPSTARGTLLSDYHGSSDPSRTSPDNLEDTKIYCLAPLTGLDVGKVSMEATSSFPLQGKNQRKLKK